MTGHAAKIETQVEKAVGALYVEFCRLRMAGAYQEEYDAMGTLINMLSQDREYLRKTNRGIKP